jgi:hypothetical protein
MKNYSLLIKLFVGGALVINFTLGLMSDPSYGQGRSLSTRQLDAIVKQDLSQCSPQSGKTASGRIDPAYVIPTRNAREFPLTRISKTLHGMWRGQVHGDNKETRVDYFWIMDTQRNEGLIIAQRTGTESMADLRAIPNAPKISYLSCAHEGYVPATEVSQIHEFTKVSNSIADAQRVLQKATGLRLSQRRATLSDLWRQIVEQGYFKSMPAVAFAGALFKPIQLRSVPSEIGPPQVGLKWDGEYYGGGNTSLKFTPGVPIKGVEYTQFIGTSAASGDFLVASTGNGRIWKVEAISGADYDLAFDSVVLGPLQ